jgi:hypothetical protein
MPDHRLTPKREGFSDKITALDDLAYRIWQQYKLSADDYGVMPDLAASIMGGNRRLAKVQPRVIESKLQGFVDCGLLHRFVHQGQGYLYSRVWQKHQKIRYPSETFHPAPPPEELAQCDKKTRELFAQRFANSSETDSEDCDTVSPPPVCARPGNANADANASAEELGERERGLVLSRGQLRSSAPALVALWNDRAVEPFVHVSDVLADKSTQRVLDALRAHPDLSWWEQRVVDVTTSAWCSGGAPSGWVADFWWMLEHADEIASGRVRNHAPQPKGSRVGATGVSWRETCRARGHELPCGTPQKCDLLHDKSERGAA